MHIVSYHQCKFDSQITKHKVDTVNNPHHVLGTVQLNHGTMVGRWWRTPSTRWEGRPLCWRTMWYFPDKMKPWSAISWTKNKIHWQIYFTLAHDSWTYLDTWGHISTSTLRIYPVTKGDISHVLQDIKRTYVGTFARTHIISINTQVLKNLNDILIQRESQNASLQWL